MKKTIVFTIILFLTSHFVFAQTSLAGKITDASTGEELIGVNIILTKNNTFVAGQSTNIDGNFSIKVDPGTYDMEVSYTGYAIQKIEKIVASAEQETRVNIQLNSGEILDEIVITAYKIPLIKQDETTGGKTVTSEQIRKLPTRNINAIAAAPAGASTSDNGQKVRMKGSRSNATNYYIDGARVDSSPEILEHNTEEYAHISENNFLSSLEKPLSTFSIDVDNASYSNVRRYLDNHQMPPKDAVRIEEFINYFSYDYPQPKGDAPFSIHTEISDCPWNAKHKLVHIGLQGYELPKEQMPPSNLVFLLDVSGSMNSSNKLPLLKKAFQLLVEQLREEDKVSIVVYAGASGLVLSPTSGNDKHKIMDALQRLTSGGSTAGAAGIQLAYQTAESAFIKNGNNRIILATDGDFNVGVSSTSELVRLVEEKRKSGVFLSVLGFGRGNYKDNRMEQLADNGNGNYAYIDNFQEAKKVFVEEMGGTLHTIAKDVKLQIEFNPTHVKEYRLVGYENRKLENEDFNNDKKDAGDLGAGHTVTAIYEIILADSKTTYTQKVDDLKYQNRSVKRRAKKDADWMTIKLRYKKPNEEVSRLLEVTAKDSGLALQATSNDFRFSAAVASFGMMLRDSQFKGDANYDTILDLAQGALGDDKLGYRKGFLDLVKKAKEVNIRLTAGK